LRTYFTCGTRVTPPPPTHTHTEPTHIPNPSNPTQPTRSHHYHHHPPAHTTITTTHPTTPLPPLYQNSIYLRYADRPGCYEELRYFVHTKHRARCAVSDQMAALPVEWIALAPVVMFILTILVLFVVPPSSPHPHPTHHFFFFFFVLFLFRCFTHALATIYWVFVRARVVIYALVCDVARSIDAVDLRRKF
jgi:hypothetical protein